MKVQGLDPKDPVRKDKGVGTMYRISCVECEAGYVSETKRSLTAQFGEHRRQEFHHKIHPLRYSQLYHHVGKHQDTVRGTQMVWQRGEGGSLHALTS